MHASTEQLLSLRDGEQLPREICEHVAACEACQTRLGQFSIVQAGLKSLPELEVPDHLWSSIAAGQPAAGFPVWGRRLAWAGGMAAAVAALALTLNVAFRGDGPGAGGATPESVARMADKPVAGGSADAAPGTTDVAEEAPPLEDLVLRSQVLERRLRAVPEGPELVSAGTAGTISELQDRIALVDYQLSLGPEVDLTPTQSRQLWQERVDLMNSLLQVRYAQAQRVYF